MKGKNEGKKEKFNCDGGNENRDVGTGIDYLGNHAHSSNSTADSKLKIANKKQRKEMGGLMKKGDCPLYAIHEAGG